MIEIFEIIKLLKDSFIQRTDAYAVQEKTGKYKKIGKELALDDLKDHLEGKKTIGTYQFNKESKLKWLCFDFDGIDLEKELEKAKILYSKLKENGVFSVLEFSGKKGYHVWVFCEEIDGSSARSWAKEITKDIELHEIFPKQEKIEKEGYGNLVKIPLGIHQVSENRSFFFNEKFEELNQEQSLELLQQAEKQKTKIPKVVVREIIKTVIKTPEKITPPEYVLKLISEGRPEGERHLNTFIIVKELWHCGFSNNEILEQVKNFNKNSKPPQPERIIKAHVEHLLENQEKYLSKESITEKDLKTLEEIEKRLEEKPRLKGQLNPLPFSFFKNLKPDKNFLIKDFLLPGTCVMIFGQPACKKSLLSNYLGLCISTEKEFLGLQTKKTGVLLLDNENSLQLLRDRLVKIFSGMKREKERIPKNFWTLSRTGCIDNQDSAEKLLKLTEEKKIGLLIIDTLRRAGTYEENSSSEINEFFQEVFCPLLKKGVCIIFLHHSQKQKDKVIYRGSSDLLGFVDSAFSMETYGETGFILKCEKSRTTEPEKIIGEVEFEEDFFKFREIDVEIEEAKNIGKKKEISDSIKGLFTENASLKRGEISKQLTSLGVEFSGSSLKRSLNFLLRVGFLKKTGPNYSLVEHQETLRESLDNQPEFTQNGTETD